VRLMSTSINTRSSILMSMVRRKHTIKRSEKDIDTLGM
jgi:hypothetical protein